MQRKARRNLITGGSNDAKLIRDVVHYDIESGEFTNIIHRGRAGVGRKSGSASIYGRRKYLRIFFNGRLEMAHRLAWLYVYGDWPNGEIDHIDGNGMNNRISNLRDVTRAENRRNVSRYKNNTSGVTGVSFGGNRWFAYIEIYGERKQLGRFINHWDAVCARKAAEYQHGFHVNHGRTWNVST